MLWPMPGSGLPCSVNSLSGKLFFPSLPIRGKKTIQLLTLNHQCWLPALLPEGATVQALIFFLHMRARSFMFDVYISATLAYTAYTLCLASPSLRFGFNMAFADRFALDYTPPHLHDILRQLTPTMPKLPQSFPTTFSSTGVFYIADCQLAVMLEIRCTIHSNISSSLHFCNKTIGLKFSVYNLNVSYQNCFGQP